jgi:hypothetical protein
LLAGPRNTLSRSLISDFQSLIRGEDVSSAQKSKLVVTYLAMMMMLLPPWTGHAFLLTALLGPVSHYCLWVRFEVDNYVELVLILFLFLQPTLLLALRCGANISLITAYLLSCFLQATYLVALAASISVYRLFLHPTRVFPGPFWARLSAWWRLKFFADSGTKGFSAIDEMHKKYGDVVRLGMRIV